MKATAENTDVRAVEDAAWNIKDIASDMYGRVLSDRDKATLASVLRDLERTAERMVGLRDKRRRGAAELQPAAEVEAEP